MTKVFKSALREMQRKHFMEEEELRKKCPHLKSYLKMSLDDSSVGAGSCYPSIHITCRNCGTKKIIFHLNPEKRKTVKKQLKRQGFKDERLNCYTQYSSDLE